MKNILFAVTILSSATMANVPSWITDVPAIYWFGEDNYGEGITLTRGNDLRDDPAAHTGTATSTDEKYDRTTQTWVAQNQDEYYLDQSNGSWNQRGNTYEFNITGSGDNIMEVFDGFARLNGGENLVGKTIPFNPCFNLPQGTFSAGAEKYSFSWKQKEKYKLNWSPENWSNNPPTPYSTLDDFVNAHNPFLNDNNTRENAGFRLDANLSDGTGDLVVIFWDENGTHEGRTIGDWNASYVLPGQDPTTSIKFNITESGFLDNEADFEFATVFDSKVWIGSHSPAGTAFEPMTDFTIYNEVAYNDYVNFIDTHKNKLTKLLICDIKDKKFRIEDGFTNLWISYYGNMNFITEADEGNGRYQISGGEWTVENGVIVRDTVMNDINKTVTVDVLNMQQPVNPNLMHTVTGRGQLISTPLFSQQEGNLPETAIPHAIVYADIKGKKINLTYRESGSPDETGDVYLFENMTYAFGDSGEDVGVWKIENGILVLDSYWLNATNNTTETDVESWVFSDATHANIYISNIVDANITIHTIAPLDGTESIPANFTGDPVDTPFSVDMLAGNMITIGDAANANAQDKLYFYTNMTYKQETYDDNSNPLTITGSWSVEEGVVIVDVVYLDNKSVQYVINFHDSAQDSIDYMGVVAGATERDDAVPILSVSPIPSAQDNSATLPAVIMYLLN